MGSGLAFIENIRIRVYVLVGCLLSFGLCCPCKKTRRVRIQVGECKLFLVCEGGLHDWDGFLSFMIESCVDGCLFYFLKRRGVFLFYFYSK